MLLTWGDIKKATETMSEEQLAKRVSVFANGTIYALNEIVKLETDLHRDFPGVWASPGGTGDLLYSKGDTIIRI